MALLATSITVVVFSERGAGLLNVIINNSNNPSNNNNVYILYSIRGEMGCLSITLNHKEINIYLSETHSLHSKMTYIAFFFFCWFAEVCFVSLTLAHLFFSLWVIL